MRPNNSEEIISITQTIYKMLNSSDQKDYVMQQEQIADEIIIDFGGVKPSQTLKRDDLVNWSKIAYKDMTTLHMNFNQVVTINGDKANVNSSGRALHKIKIGETEEFWNIYAQYYHELIKDDGLWKISKLRMTPIFEEGDSSMIEKNFERNVKEAK